MELRRSHVGNAAKTMWPRGFKKEEDAQAECLILRLLIVLIAFLAVSIFLFAPGVRSEARLKRSPDGMVVLPSLTSFAKSSCRALMNDDLKKYPGVLLRCSLLSRVRKR